MTSSNDIHISLVFAMATNRVIGRNNQLPWYLPNDLKYFKQITMGKPIVMGRKTFDSIGKPLPGRTNIVITRNTDWQHEGVVTVTSVEEAIAHANSLSVISDCDELMIIGGAEIYTLCMPLATRLYLTEVHADVDGDAYFPEFDKGGWKEVAREDFSAEGPNPYNYSFVVLERLSQK